MTSTKGFGQVLRNIAWHSSEKILRMLISFLVGIWLARYLGPERFGNFNYIMAWLGMFNAIAWLGVGETVMRDMVRDRGDEGRILGSALMIRLCGSLLSIGLAIGMAKWFGGFDETQLILLAILCVGVPFAETPAGIWMWFASHTNIGPVVLGKNISMILGALLRVGVIVADAGLIALIAALAFESVLLWLCLFGAYLWFGQRFSHWRFDFRHAWRMLLTGLPIILSSLIISLNARVDQIMLGRLTGMTDVGVYAAAMRFSEVWWMVPPMIVQTLASRYIYPRDLGEQLQNNVARIIAGMALLSLLPCLLIAAVGPGLIGLFLGKQYLGAGSILVIHIWTAVLIFIDAPVGQYLLATHRQSLLVLKSVVLLFMNFGLILVLVPQYGPQGAAVATLIAMSVTVLALPMLYPPLRDLLGVYRLAVSEAWGLPALCAKLMDAGVQRRRDRKREVIAPRNPASGRARRVGAALLLVSELTIWGILVIGLLSGALSVDPWSSRITWVLPVLSALLLLSVFVGIILAKRRQVPGFMLIALLFLVYNASRGMIQWHSLDEFAAGFNHHFQAFGMIMALALIAFTPQSYVRWRKFLIVVAALQFPFALYELLARQRGGWSFSSGATENIAGTFGTHGMEGGPNSAMAMYLYLFITLSFLVSRWRSGLINSRIFYPLAFLCLLPLGMGNTAIAAVMLPLVGLMLFRESLSGAFSRHLPVMLALILSAVLLGGLSVSILMHGNPGEAMPPRIIRDLAHSWLPCLGHFTAILFWAEQQGFHDPLGFLIGHGLGSAHVLQDYVNAMPGHLGFKYPRHEIHLTGASTLLWDTGLIGFLLFVSIFIAAWSAAGRLRRSVSDPAVKADAFAIQAAIPLFLLSAVYSTSIVNLLSMELIHALVLGYLGYLMNHHGFSGQRAATALPIESMPRHDMAVLTETKNY